MILDLNEFQTWAFGDSLDNTLRGIVGEFIVLKAVKGEAAHRLNWDGFDILMTDSTKIEVKVSGYVQSWQQKDLNIIEFDIEKKNPWVARENRYLGYKCRYADIWVFAVHREQDRQSAKPFDTDQWDFLVTSTTWLDEVFKDQKSVRYSVLQQKGLKPVGFDELAATIDSVKTALRQTP